MSGYRHTHYGEEQCSPTGYRIRYTSQSIVEDQLIDAIDRSRATLPPRPIEHPRTTQQQILHRFTLAAFLYQRGYKKDSLLRILKLHCNGFSCGTIGTIDLRKRSRYILPLCIKKPCK